jgi:hypothetical protein
MSMMIGMITPDEVASCRIFSRVADFPPPVSPDRWPWRAPCLGS